MQRLDSVARHVINLSAVASYIEAYPRRERPVQLGLPAEPQATLIPLMLKMEESDWGFCCMAAGTSQFHLKFRIKRK